MQKGLESSMILTLLILSVALCAFSSYKWFHECDVSWIPGFFIGVFLSFLFFMLSITVPVRTEDFLVNYTCEQTSKKVFVYTSMGDFENTSLAAASNWSKKYPGFVRVSYDSFGNESSMRTFFVKIP